MNHMTCLPYPPLPSLSSVITKLLIKKKICWKNRSDSRHIKLYRFFFSFVVVNVIYLLHVEFFSFVTLRFIEF